MEIPKIFSRHIINENVEATQYGFEITRLIRIPWWSRVQFAQKEYMQHEKGVYWMGKVLDRIRLITFTMTLSAASVYEIPWYTDWPPHTDKYLVTYEDGVVDTQCFNITTGWLTTPEHSKIIAWSFMPQGYKKEVKQDGSCKER